MRNSMYTREEISIEKEVQVSMINPNLSPGSTFLSNCTGYVEL